MQPDPTPQPISSTDPKKRKYTHRKKLTFNNTQPNEQDIPLSNDLPQITPTHDLISQINKLEQNIFKYKRNIILQRKKFLYLIQSISKYLDFEQIMHQQVEDYLESISPNMMNSQDSIEEKRWIQFMMDRNEAKELSCFLPQFYKGDPKQNGSNLIRIQRPEEIQKQLRIEYQQQVEIPKTESIFGQKTIEEGSIGSDSNRLQYQEVKKRKRRTKQEMILAQQQIEKKEDKKGIMMKNEMLEKMKELEKDIE